MRTSRKLVNKFHLEIGFILEIGVFTQYITSNADVFINIRHNGANRSNIRYDAVCTLIIAYFETSVLIIAIFNPDASLDAWIEFNYIDYTLPDAH